MAKAQRNDYSVPRPACQTEGCEEAANNNEIK
jgi:hypothetical protein